MKTVAATVPAGCDDRAVATIVHGNFSASYPAIGLANVPTLQRAAQGCAEAETEARANGQPWSQYRERATLCRGRIRRITEQQKEAF